MNMVVDAKATASENMMKAISEMDPQIEASKASVGGLNTALNTLLGNDQAMNILIDRFNPSSKVDSMTKVIETSDKRFSLSISTDKNSRKKVMLRENTGTVPEESLFFLNDLNSLRIDDPKRIELLKEIGFQDDGSNKVFANQEGSLRDLQPTLEERILRNPILLKEFTSEKFINGFRSLMTAAPESANI